MATRLATTVRIIGRSVSHTRAGPSRIAPSVYAYTYESRRLESHSAALKRAEAARERAVKNPAFFKNDAIPYPRVRLVNAEGKLEPETKLKDLLGTVDLKSNFLQLVTIDPPDGGKPLVKIINKHEAAQKEREQKAKKKEQKKVTAGQETKDIRLSWAVEPGDLKHKVVKMVQELEKKNRVNVVFVPKKGVPVPPQDQMIGRMDKVWENVKHVATEWKPRTAGDLTGSMYLQGLGKPEE